MDPRLDIKEDEDNNLAAINNTNPNEDSGIEDPYAQFTEEETPPPFRSRFKSWIRTVALVVVLIFVPEQICWAFNYNPLVLWGNTAASLAADRCSLKAQTVIAFFGMEYARFIR